MSVDVERAAAFLTTHGRLLDRRRLAVLLPAAPDPAAVLSAVDGYRNADGGYGWGIEPDLRAAESQPAGALHALEAIADAGVVAPSMPALMDWLASASLPDGGLPFAVPIADASGCAPFWAQADPEESSVQITAGVVAQAHRVARNDPAVRDHPWLARATRFCLDAIADIDEPPFAYVLSFALQLLDTVADTHPEATDLVAHLAPYLPADGAVPVDGGAEGETLHLLDVSRTPEGPVRDLLDPAAVDADLDRLETGQQEDGGWAVDFTSYSDAATLEWRGYATVAAIATLRAHGR